MLVKKNSTIYPGQAGCHYHCASLDPRATGGRKTKSRSKTAPVSTNAPEEYAERFKARPTTRPAVIDFNGTTVKLHTTRAVRRSYPGFPPVKTMHVQSKQAQPKTPANEEAGPFHHGA
nr:hypothetical protein BaRGS_023189 [Batillaria attramentaria]